MLIAVGVKTCARVLDINHMCFDNTILAVIKIMKKVCLLQC